MHTEIPNNTGAVVTWIETAEVPEEITNCISKPATTSILVLITEFPS